MPDISSNKSAWSGWYDWRGAGEEWSVAWGNSEAQWFGSIFPRIHRSIPARAILEIAPGFGRWTAYLLPHCDTYLGIDLSDECVTSCKKRFARISKAKFSVNDGLSLAAAQDGAFDFVFSFDSLVHAGADVLEAYVKQMLKKLKPHGTAFLHHSNLLEFAGEIGNPHHRDETVSAALVETLIANAGGRLIVQEKINWGGPDLNDCLTTFERPGSGRARDPIYLRNPRFMDAAQMIADYYAPYAG